MKLIDTAVVRWNRAAEPFRLYNHYGLRPTNRDGNHARLLRSNINSNNNIACILRCLSVPPLDRFEREETKKKKKPREFLTEMNTRRARGRARTCFSFVLYEQDLGSRSHDLPRSCT